eukprot:3602835-Amphidinium_carterae.1
MAAPQAKTGKLERLPSKRQLVCAEEKAKKTVEKTLELRAAERVETRISEIGQVLRSDLSMLEKVYSLVFDGEVLKISEQLPPEGPAAYKHLRRATNSVLVELFSSLCADCGRPLLALIAAKDPEGLAKILYTATWTEPSHGIGPRGIAEWKQAYQRRIMDCGNMLEILPHAVKDGKINTQKFGCYLLMPVLEGECSDEIAKKHKYTSIRCADFEVQLSEDIVVSGLWKIEANWSIKNAMLENPAKSVRLSVRDLFAKAEGFNEKTKPFFESPAVVYAAAKAKSAKGGRKRRGSFSPRTPKRKQSGASESTPQSTARTSSAPEAPTDDPPEDEFPDMFTE